MCGRFYLDSDREIIERMFEVELGELEYNANYNITPSLAVLTITQDREGRHAQKMRWGLIPAWAKGIDSRYSMINARAESIHQKPAYKRPFLRSRCVIPATGYYEWKKEKNGKLPYCIAREDGKPMAFAGIWDTWQNDDEEIRSCSIVTTQAADAIKSIHERMPVILEGTAFDDWLDPNNQNIEQLRGLLLPEIDGQLGSWPVSTDVNSPANNGAELIKAI